MWLSPLQTINYSKIIVIVTILFSQCSNYSLGRLRGCRRDVIYMSEKQKSREVGLTVAAPLPVSPDRRGPTFCHRLPVTRLRIVACLIISAIMQSKYMHREEN